MVNHSGEFQVKIWKSSEGNLRQILKVEKLRRIRKIWKFEGTFEEMVWQTLWSLGCKNYPNYENTVELFYIPGLPQIVHIPQATYISGYLFYLFRLCNVWPRHFLDHQIRTHAYSHKILTYPCNKPEFSKQKQKCLHTQKN